MAQATQTTQGTSRDAATLLVDRFQVAGVLDQENAVDVLRQHFGERFVTANRNGRYGIDKSVLRIFRELAPNAVWNKCDTTWYRA